MARGVEIAEIHEAQPDADAFAINGAAPTDEGDDEPDTSPVSQASTDAVSLGFPAYAASDANALQDMLEQSLRNEAKALRKHAAWIKAQGDKGKELARDYSEHRQRTSRLYALLTDGVDGSSSR